MFKHDTNSDKPCPHMKGLVSALADDALTGIARWFTVHHVAGCPRCQNGLNYFQALSARLNAVGDTPVARLTPERWVATEAAWEEADREKAGAATQP